MRPTGQLEKSLAALTIGIASDRQQREQALADAHTGEHIQQVQVDLSGQLTSSWGYADKDVAFLMPFLSARSQRQVPFEVPHFSYGVEFVTQPSDLVVITAHVLSWRRSPENWITGARVRFAAVAPNAQPAPPSPSLRAEVRVGTSSGSVSFNATAHLTFEGYATYAEGEEFQQ